MSQARSGLRTVTREFSSSQETFESVDWAPSPERTTLVDIRNVYTSAPVSKPKPDTAASAAKAARLAAITAACANMKTDSDSSSSASKRPSPSEDVPGPAKKKRLIPWEVEKTPRVIDLTDSKPVRSSGSAKPAGIFLSHEQKHILKLVQTGESVFYTGSAGTGKSVLLREIVKALRFKYAKSQDSLAITASTGIAACNIGGMTIHSFAGIGIGEGTVDQLAVKVKRNKKSMGRWMRTKTLIIDEVSMVDGELFDKLALLGSKLRKNAKPFGGIQLIITGDFFQLPPVTHRGDPTFAFEAQTWHECITSSFKLNKVFRQQDPTFVNMLNEMRYGKLTSQSIAKFRQLQRPVRYADNIEPTELFPRREDVESSNNGRNVAIRGDAHSYHAQDGGTIADLAVRDKLIANCMFPKRLDLKVGSQVMLIKNTDEQLVNGSLGRVIRFETPGSWKGDQSTEKDEKDDKKKKAKMDTMMYPIVSFGEGSRHQREVMVQPETWKSETPTGEIQASRVQLPLILSWAMSIHKSQGQTLERVKVDLGRVFEKGQAYVALSRATSLDGLQVLNFDERKVMVHPKVVRWSETLNCIEEKSAS